MNIASIDIGTNTVLMLIAEVNSIDKSIKTIKNLYRMPRIGKGVLSDGRISDKKIEELLDILTEFKSEAENYNCIEIIVAGTNALRIAVNGPKIISRIKMELNLDIKIISGKDEAKISFLGAIYSRLKNEYMVIDIGGGSTEIILGNYNEIIFSKSFDTGAVSLTEKFFVNDPPSHKEVNLAERYLNEIFAELHEFKNKSFNVIGVAGTPTSLACIDQHCKIYSDNIVENYILKYSQLSNLIEYFKKTHSTELSAAYPEVLVGREDIILAGSLILEKILNILNKNEIIVSTKGIRYGLIADYILKQ